MMQVGKEYESCQEKEEKMKFCFPISCSTLVTNWEEDYKDHQTCLLQGSQYVAITFWLHSERTALNDSTATQQLAKVRRHINKHAGLAVSQSGVRTQMVDLWLQGNN